MRITIDVDASELKQIQRITGQKKKSPAIAQALSQFLRQQERQHFLERALSGQTDFSLTNDELEARDIDETH
jgi:Arc/MetJ family transcription regulator